MKYRHSWASLLTAGPLLFVACGNDENGLGSSPDSSVAGTDARGSDADDVMPPDARSADAGADGSLVPDVFLPVHGDVGSETETSDTPAPDGAIQETAAPIDVGNLPPSGTCSEPTALMFSASGRASASGGLSGPGMPLDDGIDCASTGPYAVFRFATTTSQAFSAHVTSTSGRKLMLSLRANSCEAGSLTGCNGGLTDRLSRSAMEPGTHYLFVRGMEPGDLGAFTLSAALSEAIAPGSSCELPWELKLQPTEAGTWMSGAGGDQRVVAWRSDSGTTTYFAVPLTRAGTLTVDATVTDGEASNRGSLAYQRGTCAASEGFETWKPLALDTPATVEISVDRPTMVYLRLVGNWQYALLLKFTTPP